MNMVVIYISDWNLKDRVLVVPTDKAKAILLDRSRLAEDRMNAVYELAKSEGKISHDPLSSEIETADLYLSWPGTAIGFISNKDWDAEHADGLEFFEQ